MYVFAGRHSLAHNLEGGIFFFFPRADLFISDKQAGAFWPAPERSVTDDEEDAVGPARQVFREGGNENWKKKKEEER